VNGQSRTLAGFEWTDGQGAPWHVEVSAEAIGLSGPDRRESIPAAQWAGRITIQRLGESFVLRFDLSDRQVGFLLSAGEARSFLVHAGLLPEVPPSEPAVPPEPVTRPVPTDVVFVQARAVWALVLACFAFIPVAGLALGVAAGVLAATALASSGKQPNLAHNRLVAWVAIALTAWSLVVNVGASYTLLYAPEATHLTVLADGASTGQQGRDWGMIVASVLVILLALSVHEAAHGVTAWWCGDQTARWLGRVTLNPIKHIDPIGTVILPAILIFMGSPVFGWARPVPVDRSRLRNRRTGDMFVSFAGPLSNVLQAALCLSVLLAIGVALRLIDPQAEVQNFSAFAGAVRIRGFPGAQLLVTLVVFCKMGVLINLLLATLNMIPIPPLDGSWILGSLFPTTAGRLINQIRPYGFLILIGLLYVGAIDVLLAPAAIASAFGHLLVRLATGL
jgi:Zn-dependent protease